MLTETIIYEDYDGNNVSEEFSFHISKGDVAEMQMAFGTDKNLTDYLTEIIKDNDGAVIIKNFKWFLEMSVGRREGKHFLKSEEITRDFMATNAYSEFLQKLITDAKYAASFINGLFPREVSESAELQDAVKKINPSSSPAVENSPAAMALEKLSKEELVKLIESKQ